MSESERSLSLEGDEDHVDPEDNILLEPDYKDNILQFIKTIIETVLESIFQEPETVLTFEQAGQCLSTLGKIWNITECPELCDMDSDPSSKTSDQRLLDIEGYVDEYQYLHLRAVDMELSDIRVIPQHFIWLLSVDVSGNRLTNISACPLTKLPNLVSVKLNRNQITDPYLKPMKHLQYLGLNSNKIESLHRIYHPNLTNLDVKWNNISEIDGQDCWKLKRLRELELTGNKLTSTTGIEYQNLVALYLAENQIVKLLGLERLPNLRRLHLRKNPLSDLSGFSAENRNLEYLNVRSCRIENVQELKKLKILQCLKVLVVKDNLFNPSTEAEHNGEEEQQEQQQQQQHEDDEEDEDDSVRIQILMILPQLQRLNKTFVTREEWKKARSMLEEQESL